MSTTKRTRCPRGGKETSQEEKKRSSRQVPFPVPFTPLWNTSVGLLGRDNPPVTPSVSLGQTSTVRAHLCKVPEGYSLLLGLGTRSGGPGDTPQGKTERVTRRGRGGSKMTSVRSEERQRRGQSPKQGRQGKRILRERGQHVPTEER